MKSIIVMMCGIMLIVDGGVLAYRVIQHVTEESELILEHIVAAIVGLIAVSVGVFFIASV
jgi:hypothetical protein